MRTAFTSLSTPVRRPARFTPTEIARHRLLTSREKLDLLERLRVQIASHAHSVRVGFGPAEVDRAIDDVRYAAESGDTPPLPASRGK